MNARRHARDAVRAPPQLRMEKLPDEGTTEETRKGTTAEVMERNKIVNGGHEGEGTR